MHLITLSVVLAIVIPLKAWWDVGHMLTSAIAEIRLNQLDPFISIQFRDLVKSINKLCDNKTQTLIESACWPDDLKSNQYSMHLWDSWHFSDSPYVEDGTFAKINFTQASVNSIAVIQNAVKVLKGNVLKNTAQRALFARYLIHVVGDIHQPLHSVALYNKTYPKGDIGGNLLKIINLQGQTQNFHAFWDAGANLIQNDSWKLIRPLDQGNMTVLKTRAKSLIDQYGSQIEDLAKNIDPAAWVLQSFRIAINTTYPRVAVTNQAGIQYTNLVYQTSLKRITLAGYRLANIVIDIYNNHYKVDQYQNLKQIWQKLKKEVIKLEHNDL